MSQSLSPGCREQRPLTWDRPGGPALLFPPQSPCQNTFALSLACGAALVLWGTDAAQGASGAPRASFSGPGAHTDSLTDFPTTPQAPLLSSGLETRLNKQLACGRYQVLIHVPDPPLERGSLDSAPRGPARRGGGRRALSRAASSYNHRITLRSWHPGPERLRPAVCSRGWAPRHSRCWVGSRAEKGRTTVQQLCHTHGLLGSKMRKNISVSHLCSSDAAGPLFMWHPGNSGLWFRGRPPRPALHGPPE